MHRLRLVAMLLAGAFLIPISKADAQDPLKIYCNSPGQVYCVAFMTYAVEFNGTAETGVSSEWSSTVQLFGSGYEGYTGSLFVGTRASFAGTDCSIGLQDRELVNGVGYYGLTDAAGGCFSTPETSTIHDLSVIVFAQGVTPACRPGIDCVEIPEPGPLPLMAAGMLGLGIVAWRRREKNAA